MGNSEYHNNSTAVDAGSGDQWLLEITSQKLHLWTVVAAAIASAIHIFMGIAVDFGDTGAPVTTIDQLVFPTIGLIIAGVILLLTRTRVRVNARGVEVCNLLSKKFYPWVGIYSLSFPKKSRWTRLELPNFESVLILAIQSADGSRVVEDIRRLRELEDKLTPED